MTRAYISADQSPQSMAVIYYLLFVLDESLHYGIFKVGGLTVPSFSRYIERDLNRPHARLIRSFRNSTVHAAGRSHTRRIQA